MPLQLTYGLYKNRVADTTIEEIQLIQNSANQLEESTIILLQRFYTVNNAML